MKAWKDINDDPLWRRLRPLSFGAILADPPWRFANWSAAGEKKNATAHYRCMDVGAIMSFPVHSLAAPNCLLVMWATAPMLPQAVDTMKAWGFKFKSAGAWAKQSKTGASLAFGPGYLYRSAAEFFLAGTIGKPKYKSHSVRNLIVSPVREHSRKPDQMYLDIEALVDGPYLELFSRCDRPGWSAWGDEIGKFK